MRIAELHETPFSFKERLVLAFAAGLCFGFALATLVWALVAYLNKR